MHKSHAVIHNTPNASTCKRTIGVFKRVGVDMTTEYKDLMLFYHSHEVYGDNTEVSEILDNNADNGDISEFAAYDKCTLIKE